MLQVAVLDDYQRVALELADWSALEGRAEVTVFDDHLVGDEALAARLAPYDVIVAMRERTPFREPLLNRLPNLRLLVTTGTRNASIDLAACEANDVLVCGTGMDMTTTVELTWALILAAVRNLVDEVDNLRSGRWQTTVGTGLRDKTLGVIGLGRIGSSVAEIGRAFGMSVVAWSKNLTDEQAAAVGAARVPLEALLADADVVTIHQVLSRRTRGLIGADQLARMKSTAWLINTSRGPIVETQALLAALERGAIAGAAIDVFDEEPLTPDSPLRHTPRLLATPHIGYVTDGILSAAYTEAVEDIVAFLDGKPLRVISRS